MTRDRLSRDTDLITGVVSADGCISDAGIEGAVAANRTLSSLRTVSASTERRIPYVEPSITELEVQYAADAAANGWGERQRMYVDRFEEQFSLHLGVPHSIATSSCTGALHMGLHALGVGPGTEVIMADTNWIATVAPVVHLGATPVFVDVLPTTWCLDPDQVEEAITGRTRAIVATHLYGNLCDMDALLAIGTAHSIPVVEDAAEAIGSVYGSHRAGSMGRFGVFSFHGSKTITTGEGGMFVTNDHELFERVLTLSNHGRPRSESRQFWPHTVGFKYKMSNIQAAVGCAQLQRIDTLVHRKRQILRQYEAEFVRQKVPYWSFNHESAGCTIGAWMSTVVLEEPSGTSDIADVMSRNLRAKGVDARPFFSPLTSTVPFRASSGSDLDSRWSYRLPRVSLNLPCAHGITDDDIGFVVATIADSL